MRIKCAPLFFFWEACCPGAGRIAVSYPGGCTIGRRPVDLHLAVLRAMGARIREDSRGFWAEADQLHGCRYRFPKVSVGATENAVMAATAACGESRFFQLRERAGGGASLPLSEGWRGRISGERGRGRSACGARHASGRRNLRCLRTGLWRARTCWREPPRGGKFPWRALRWESCEAVLDVYQKMGGQYEVKSGTLVTDSSRVGLPVPYLETAAYPGFPTDLQSPLAAVCATLAGRSRIRETIFEDRFRAAVELRKMGALIRQDGNELEICGGRLRGAGVCAWDLRGGAALVAAGLAAEGTTEISSSGIY